MIGVSMNKYISMFLLMILSFTVYGETFVCAFSCYGAEDKICINEWTRSKEGFKDKYGTRLSHVETENHLLLVNYGADELNNIASTSILIDKEELSFIKNGVAFDELYPDIRATPPKQGKCTIK